MAKPVAVVTAQGPDGVTTFNAFDVGAEGANAAIGDALLSQLATADIGHTYSLSVTVYLMQN
jgi:hypothetical protein